MTTTEHRKWTTSLVDGWWCVYLSDGSLGAKFAREGDALGWIEVAGDGYCHLRGRRGDYEPSSFLDPTTTLAERVFDAIDATTDLLGEEIEPAVKAVLVAVAKEASR